MIPKLAIEKAIEGGWDDKGLIVFYEKFVARGDAAKRIGDCAVALDPTFWQALGKALGWTTVANGEGHRHSDTRTYEWHYRAHRFYDLILTQQDTEPFFTDLLNK